MADDTSSLSFLRHPFCWLVMGLAGAVGSVWGKRLGEDRPLLGYIVFILGLVLIADRSRLGHQLGVRSSCRSSSASSPERVTQVARTPADRARDTTGCCARCAQQAANADIEGRHPAPASAQP